MYKQLILFWFNWLLRDPDLFCELTDSQSIISFDLFSPLLDCYIILANSLQSLFRHVPISLSLFTLDLDWMHSPTIVLKHVEALSCCNVLISYLIIWITFKYLSCHLVDISHWLLCNILDEIWSFELIIFKGIHICIFHMSLIGNGNTPKALIGCLSCPIDSNAPGIQLAMWLGKMKIFRTMLCTLCQNYYYIQYATMWLPLHAEVQYLHSGCQLLVNFMYFYCFRVFHREFLWPTRCQMSFNFNIIAWMPNVCII